VKLHQTGRKVPYGTQAFQPLAACDSASVTSVFGFDTELSAMPMV